MSRSHLLRGVSASAVALFAFAEFYVAPAAAQQSLPTISVGGQNRGARPSAPRASGPATNAAPATNANVAASPAPGPAPVSVWSPTLPDGKPAFVKRWQLPNIVASVNREYIRTKINIVDTQDALKYVPGVWVRKLRGGTEGLIQSRTWGLSAARNLVYVDDLLISQLINNGHPDSQPRWGLVSPEEIERIDVLYGPYAAQYPGNSMGGVYQITTRMPEKLELTAKQTVAVQDYDWWGVKRPFTTTQTALTGGDKVGNL